MLDNVADMVLLVSLLTGIFGFPVEFVLSHMIPGTALGVLVGDLAYTAMATRLSRRLGRPATAMPLGLDTPSTFGMVSFVLGPAYKAALAGGATVEVAATSAWRIGICAIVLSGVFKLACSLAAGSVRRLVPRAGLLGSLAAIALVLISFLPLLEVFESPLVGITPLVIILGSLVAGLAFPGRMPGSLVAVVVGSGLYYAVHGLAPAAGLGPAAELGPGPTAWWPTAWLDAWRFEWLGSLGATLPYLPVVIPFALATVVGGIDCTESAAAVGDEYDTRSVIAIEGLAAIVAGCSGGVIQSTPYIGHPAYKAMGGRAGYTLATAILVGAAGVIGFFSLLNDWLPKAAVFPILVFIGLEITKQSYLAMPRRHYAAVALACVPAMAYLVMMFVDNLLGQTGLSLESLPPTLGHTLQTLRMLANGFVVTSLLWGSMLAALVDRRFNAAAVYLAIAGACSLFGVIHSPFAGSPLAWPWGLPAQLPVAEQGPWRLLAAYLLAAGFVAAWGFFSPAPTPARQETAPLGKHDASDHRSVRPNAPVMPIA